MRAFTYPALMAGDILSIRRTMPVGADQTQHLEFTRNVAARFNYVYGETFRLPAISRRQAHAS